MRQSAAVLLIIAVAVAARAAVLLDLAPYPRFELIRNRLDDQLFIDDWARTILHDPHPGLSLYAGEARASDGAFPRAPFYPYFLALLYRCVGYHYDLVRGIQQLGGIATTALIYSIAAEYFGPTAAVAAGIIAALYGPFLFYEVTFLTTSLAVLVTALGLWLLTRATRHPAHGKSMSRALLVATGVVLGIGVTLRPETIVFALVAVGWAHWPDGAVGQVRFPRLLLLAGLCLSLLPPIAYNTARSGRPAFVSANGLDNFLIGNLHDAPGNAPEHTPSYLEIKRQEATGSTTLLRAAVADFLAYPRTVALLELRKLGYFWSGYEIPNNLNFYLARRCNAALARLPLQFGLVLPLALLGIGVSVAHRRRCALLYLFMVVFTSTSVMFFVLSRLRQPIVVPLIVFAGGGVAWWVESVRAKAFTQATLGLAVVAAGSSLLHPREAIRPTDYAMAAAAYFSHGQELEARDQPIAARKEYIEALVLNPAHAPALERVRALSRPDSRTITPAPEIDALCTEARARVAAQEYEAALRLLDHAARREPAAVDVYRCLANVYFLSGDTERAATALERAVTLAPLDGQLRQNLWALRGSP